MKKQNLVDSHIIFISFLITVPTVIIAVYFTGISNHRTLYSNALITTTILSAIFFLFITLGLYKGWKLKETVGRVKDFFKLKLSSKLDTDTTSHSFDILSTIEFGEDGEGCLISIVYWLLAGILGAILLVLFGDFFFGIITFLGAIIYWLVYRSFRLIFKNSPICIGDLFKSISIAFKFTILYFAWIYIIIFLSNKFL